MKLGKFLSMGVLSVLALGACTPNADDNSEWNDGSQPVSFKSQIQGVKTRAVNNAWNEEGSDQVGVFVKQNGAFGDAVNKHYYVSAEGNLSTASAGDAIYYPENGDKVDFVAYYPYVTNLTNNAYAVDVTDQSSQPAIDLLYSINATNKDKTVTTPVQLTFKHQLAKIVLNITKDATIPTLEGLKVAVTGTKTKGAFALLNGVLTPDDGSVQNIAAKVSNAGTLAETIILPVNGLSGATITFTIGDKTKTWNIPEGQNYVAGSQYTYPVTIKETGGQISVSFGDASIDDWTPVVGGDIDIDFGNGGGEVDPPTPGGEEKTIFEEKFGDIKHAGEDPVFDANKTKIAQYKDWDNADLTFTDEYGTWADVRYTKTCTNAIWFPANTDGTRASSLKISGFDTANYTNLKLIYDIAVQTANNDQNVIKVKCGEQVMTVPSKVFSRYNEYASVELTGIPDGIASIEFISDGDNKVGYRIDNVKLVGTTK